jgi:hypothetical protein
LTTHAKVLNGAIMKIQGSFQRMAMVCSVVTAAALSGPKALAETPQSGHLPVWAFFQSKFPTHIQGVALAKPRSDGSRIIIVAEPPSHGTVTGLTSIAPNDFANAVVMTHGIGWQIV